MPVTHCHMAEGLFHRPEAMNGGDMGYIEIPPPTFTVPPPRSLRIIMPVSGTREET